MSETEGKWVDEESLAMALHEAGREAVEKGITVSAQKFGEEARRYTEWDELAEPAKEGRRMQARFMLERYRITRKAPEPIEEPTVHYDHEAVGETEHGIGKRCKCGGLMINGICENG
jgi:hypothetical protein